MPHAKLSNQNKSKLSSKSWYGSHIKERDIDNAIRSSRTPGPREYGGTKLERRMKREKRELMDGHRLEIANETTQLAKV